MPRSSIVWFQHDLRLADHPALAAAVARGGPVIPVFVWTPEEEGNWAPGAASRWWLHQSLAALDSDLRQLGSRLTILRGPTLFALSRLATETHASALFWSKRYEPAARAREKAVEEGLRACGVEARGFNGSVLYEPGRVLNSSGKPFQVFTPFWNACCSGPEPAAPLPRPKRLAAPSKWPRSLALDELQLEPKIDWASGIRAAWRPGEKGAHEQLRRFVREAVVEYSGRRDRPSIAGTSRLSPHLHFGEVSPRQVWHCVYGALKGRRTRTSTKAVEPFVRQLGWREFSYHLLHHLPHTTDEPLRSDFAAFPWRTDKAALKSWQRGRTGYPLVDAGMRELWATGWMHNRVRMVVASFLVKDLLIPWQEGARWFWDTLVDADLANNTMGWQWTAGCGADAAPYFRVFNPVSQAERFDPEGDYVRRWVPELGNLPATWIHKPWEAPEAVLAEAGVVLGKTYPKPIVVHAEARARALAAVASLKR